jgi:hypothetical protein
MCMCNSGVSGVSGIGGVRLAGVAWTGISWGFPRHVRLDRFRFG